MINPGSQDRVACLSTSDHAQRYKASSAEGKLGILLPHGAAYDDNYDTQAIHTYRIRKT